MNRPALEAVGPVDHAEALLAENALTVGVLAHGLARQARRPLRPPTRQSESALLCNICYHVHTCTCTCHVHVYVCVRVHMRLHVHVHVRVRVHMYMYAHVRVHVHVHAHTCAYHICVPHMHTTYDLCMHLHLGMHMCICVQYHICAIPHTCAFMHNNALRYLEWGLCLHLLRQTCNLLGSIA